MAAKRNIYVEAELEWAEKQLQEWKDYIDAHPLASLKDREGQKVTQRGGVIPYVIANIETQGKFIQDTLQKYLLLLKEVNNMRSLEEEKKIKARGIDNLSPLEDGSI
jgi:uncharacterized protein YlxP (DUF503 family)